MAMTLRLDPETDALLTKLAEQTGMSKQAVIEAAIVRQYGTLSQEAVARRVFEQVARRDAELLQRLADA